MTSKMILEASYHLKSLSILCTLKQSIFNSMSKKSELYEQYEGIVSLLKENPTTIIMNNAGYKIGQVYTIHKATHKQAETGTCGNILFSGTAGEAKRYLQGYRDLIIEILPDRLNGLTKKTKA